MCMVTSCFVRSLFLPLKHSVSYKGSNFCTARFQYYTSHLIGHKSSLISSNPNYLNTLLTECSRTENLKSSHACQIHAQLVTTSYLCSPILHTQLINLYAKSGQLHQALLIFETARQHSNIVTWTSLITHLSRSYQPFKAIFLFSQLRKQPGLSPNAHTFSAVLPACVAIGLVVNGQQVHALAHKQGTKSDIYVGSALADMYAKCGDMTSSKRAFDEMNFRNLVSWNALMVGFLCNKLYNETIKTFRDLLMEQLIPDEVSLSTVLNACSNNGSRVFGQQVHCHVVKIGVAETLDYVKNSLLDMYSKCGYLEDSMELFNSSSNRDAVAWNIIMKGWVEKVKFEEACQCFQTMLKEEISPDETSLSTILHAVAGLASWAQGASIHSLATKAGFDGNSCVASSLVTMYSRCGSLDDACLAFEETRDHLNVVSWTAMIAAYQQHGHGDCVIKLFEQMLEKCIIPDYISFVSVLSACSHNGLIGQGFKYFNSMSQYGIYPGNEHYACMVDMLGRAGRLDEAKQFIATMPIKPDASVWGALLGACMNCRNLELGEQVAQILFEIEPKNPGNYVLLSNMYAYHGMLQKAKSIRKLMNYIGMRKMAGCSWIDIKNKIYVFTVHDQSHYNTEEIYKMLNRLEKLVKEHDYVADTRFAVNDTAEYKEQSLWYHSERLALAFALISLPASAPIRIKKNLRTCGDCHTVMKLASGIFQREIVLRDINRFHHFTYGSCSCKDYW